MNENIIRFYVLANVLKNKLRTGWLDLKISKERVESIAEHIYGTLILAIIIYGEYKIDIDMYKVLKILILHETEEILMPDFSLQNGISHEKKLEMGKESVRKSTEGLICQSEIETLLNEFNERKTREAIFAYYIDKIECDFQAKLYDLEEVMNYENAFNDISTFGNKELADKVRRDSKNASDFWLEFDKIIYKDSQIFTYLLKDIQQLDKDNYNKILNLTK